MKGGKEGALRVRCNSTPGEDKVNNDSIGSQGTLGFTETGSASQPELLYVE